MTVILPAELQSHPAIILECSKCGAKGAFNMQKAFQKFMKTHTVKGFSWMSYTAFLARERKYECHKCKHAFTYTLVPQVFQVQISEVEETGRNNLKLTRGEA